MLRARQTATILSRYHAERPVGLSRGLLEVRTSYQGSPNSILKPGFSFYDPVVSENDESMEDVFGRMVRFLRQAIRRHAGSAFVAVSHGDPIAILRIGFEGKELTTSNLHHTVYPVRASVHHILLKPGGPLEIAYFNVAGAVS